MRLQVIAFVAIVAVLLPSHRTAASDAGRDWGVPGRVYTDPVTAVRVRELTSGTNAADNLYFHFPNFTADDRHLLFVWERAGATHLFSANPDTGRIRQLTADSQINARSACPDPVNARRVYLLRGPEVFALDVEDCSLRRVGEIPPPHTGGFQPPTVSGDGRWLALGKQHDAANWEIGLMNTGTGEYRTVVTQGFRIGHVQHSPKDSVIFYVWETGGYAPQRTWLVNSDGTGNRPFYYRTAQTNWFTPLKEWVTHEAWVEGTGEMTMINDKLGIMLVSKDGSARMAREGRYWHAAARPDGKWIVADDFEGRLWLVETATGNVRLLAAGLRDAVRVHSHPSFDHTGRRVQFHSGREQETVGLIDLGDLSAYGWEKSP